MSVEWELDHIILMLDPRSGEGTEFVRRGLEPSYRRAHPGQGTENLCFCFDNAFLELLWTRDRAELAANPLTRARLPERLNWAAQRACPFGIAIRPVANLAETPDLPFKAWAYKPAYLPQGMAIRIATFCDNARLPFLFTAPPSGAPADWTDGRAGMRQMAAGFTRIVAVRLLLPYAPAPALVRALKALPWIGVEWNTKSYGMDVFLEAEGGGIRRMTLPLAAPVPA